MTVSGYVNKVNSVSEVLSSDGQVFQETIAPQAFTDALSAGNEICFYLEHDPSKILATTKNGSLNLSQDDIGLKMSATISNTTYGNDAYQLIKSGIITNMSFGFLVLNDIWNDDYDSDVPLRTVTELYLSEVSAVKNPAYTDSEINARCKNTNINKLNLRGVSHVNMSEERGDKDMEKDITKFSDEELKEEMDKRSKNTDDKEKRGLEDSTIQLALRSAEMVTKFIDKFENKENRSNSNENQQKEKVEDKENNPKNSEKETDEQRSMNKEMDSIREYLKEGK